MNKRKMPILSVALYVLAGLLVLYTAWAAIHSINYISEMVSQGQLVVSGSEYDIANFYMSSCAQYALFAVILFTLGWILQKNSSGTSGKLDTENEATSSGKISGNGTDEDDFEDWFQSNDK